ncbi:MAG: 2Fe-2S iron-sulfur cluster-binding protein, partial [Oscillospiraceae bacterium]
MFTLYVNDQQVQTEKDRRLLTFLREELRLTATKDGCSEGACGTCTILVEGKKVKACAQNLSKFEGKHIVTVEGLSEREREVYTHCFGEAGAVQCGFCIPGMVISAKALLDENQSPTRAEVKTALRGNICRCTGYKKIEDAILLAADFFRENRPIPAPETSTGVNRRFSRPDVREKVLGTGEFVDDIVLPGMLYAKALRSKYPRAHVNKIDISKAEAHPGCVKILTAKDVPYNKTGHIIPDWDVMIAEGGTTRYIGDALALVCTKAQETLDEVLALIEVDYTELTPVTCPADALKADAPLIHENGNIMRKEILRRGDADTVIKKSKYVVTRKYYTPFNDHAFMEPECAIAL